MLAQAMSRTTPTAPSRSNNADREPPTTESSWETSRTPKSQVDGFASVIRAARASISRCACSMRISGLRRATAHAN